MQPSLNNWNISKNDDDDYSNETIRIFVSLNNSGIQSVVAPLVRGQPRAIDMFLIEVVVHLANNYYGV